MEQGKDKVVDSRVLPRRRRPARRPAAHHRAGQPRRLRRLRPRPARDRPQGHRDVRDDAGRRRRLRARGHHPRGHLRRPCPPAHHRRRPHVQPLLEAPGCTASARSSSPTASGGGAASTCYSDWDFARPQPALDPLAAQARRRGLQRLVHVPDPARRCCDEIGLSLPLFIKWDDSEYGLRAKEAGYPTVTFPGAAVWHVPWTDKNDALDWQAYFHQRNRFIAALLHSPYPRGGRMVRESLNHQIKHLVSMQYSTVELRHRRSRTCCAGPEALHGELRDQAGRDQRVPQAVRRRPARRPTPTPSRRCAARSRRARARTAPRSRAGCHARSPPGSAPLRQLRPARELSKQYPEAEIRAMDAKWYSIAATTPRSSRCPTAPRPRSTSATRRSSATCSSGPWRSTGASTREWPELAEAVPRGAAARSPRRRRGRRRSRPGPEDPPAATSEHLARRSRPGTARLISTTLPLAPPGYDRAARGLPPPLPARLLVRSRSSRATRAPSWAGSGPTSARYRGSACTTSCSRS